MFLKLFKKNFIFFVKTKIYVAPEIVKLTDYANNITRSVTNILVAMFSSGVNIFAQYRFNNMLIFSSTCTWYC